MIGGARMVRWAVVGCRPSGDSRNGGVSQLAICRHDDEAAYYLFRCDDLWQVVADTWHETLEAAMHQAESEYTGVGDTWQAV
jgi:hypothetical protein